MAKEGYNYYNPTEDNSEMIWDLRQTYVQIIGEILKMIVVYRQREDYSNWFKSVVDLYTEINQKLEPEERESYKELYEKTIQTINKNKSCFLKQSNNPEGNDKIKTAIRELEMYIKILMEKNKMYGAKDAYDEDEI